MELLEPDQVQRARQHDDGTLQWLMRKDQCMHCEDPGCLRACPADGAIVQYTNGIVDFQQENCIGCQYCVIGLPVRHPEVQPADQEGLQVHALLRPRRRRGSSRRASRRVRPAACSSAPRTTCSSGPRAASRQLREQTSYKNAGVYDPPVSAARTSSTCCTTRPIRKLTAGCPRIPMCPGWCVFGKAR